MENEVGIRVEEDRWLVYGTDERASLVTGSIMLFDNESKALDNFIKRLRTEKILFYFELIENIYSKTYKASTFG